MRERPEQILKYICMGLGALLFFQFVRIIWTANPLAHVVVPDLPSLADESAGTNQIQGPEGAAGGMMASPPMNPKDHSETNQAVVKMNRATGTNLQARIEPASKAGNWGTNARPSVIGTNAIGRAAISNTPGGAVAGSLTNGTASTNLANAKHSGHGRHGPMPDGMAMAMAMGSMPGAKKTTVTPVIQASIDRIIDSEILGPVIHPLPMGLLGIAGNVAFLRGADGETGLVKEGDSLGDIKLLRIGTNRVLIEQDGQKKELTIFDGMGGETLLNKSSKDSNENKDP